MPDTNTILDYAVYVISAVESNHNFAAVNYDDPITIGIMQWYGTRAAAFLMRIMSEEPTAYEQLEESLRISLSNYPASNTYWNSRGLNRLEGNSFSEIAQLDGVQRLQLNQARVDMRAYLARLKDWGFTESNPKPLIYAMCMYHQSPAACMRVVQTAGGSATLDRIFQVCMNDQTFNRYRNRYQRTYDMLQAWDGESEPPDFGDIGIDQPNGGDSGGISTGRTKLTHIVQYGDTLIAYGNTFPDGVVFYKSIGQMWVASTYSGGDPITGGNTGGGSATQAQAAVDLYMSWLGRFNYSQAGGRLSPLTSGYGDCSSTIWFAYHEALGIDVGTYTGAMESRGQLIANGKGATLPLSDMKAGDLVIFWRVGKGQGSTQSWHVEMYIGDNQFCGHGGPGKGPTIKSNANSYAGGSNWSKWMVRRYA